MEQVIITPEMAGQQQLGKAAC